MHGEIIDVESEHSAMSAAVGAALAGARTITATSSQGLALMAEVVYIAAAMRAPIVMALGNRALSGPINIHCDHSDSMLIRDSGVVQLFAENAQEAYDLMVMAPRIAEHPDVLLPVLVCQDGFTITHSAEAVTMLADRSVRKFVGSYRIPYPLLDLSTPTTQGPFAMPDYYYEVRHQQVAAMAAALGVFDEIASEYAALSGRSYGAIEPYLLDDAERAIVCLGSTGGTVKDVVDELRAEGAPVGLLEIRSFRPLPVDGDSSRTRARRPGGRARPRRLARRRCLPCSPSCRPYCREDGGGPELRLRARRPRAASRGDPGGPGPAPEIRADVSRPERRAVSRLKRLVRNENGCPPLRGGHALCQGCGVPMVVRTIIDSIETPVVVISATGCLEVATTRFPTTAWNVPGCMSLSRTLRRSRAASKRRYRALARRNALPQDGPITFVALAGDGGTYDIGLQALSGALERGHRFIFVCYDNEAYMNTGIQRSGATPFGANTTTSPSGAASLGKAQLAQGHDGDRGRASHSLRRPGGRGPLAGSEREGRGAPLRRTARPSSTS